MRVIGLLDCNSFFASCEKVFHPAWEHRAVVVLSNNDGCVVARSPEAKALGIAMGVPYFQIKRLADAGAVIVCSSNYSLYADMSHRVMQTIRQWSGDIEIYSIDESFIDLTGRFCGHSVENFQITTEQTRELNDLAHEMVATVPKWTGIPVALGIGPTKTLAKAANRLAKQTGVRYCSLLDEQRRPQRLARLAIGDVWGVGRRLLTSFQKLGLKTALDLTKVEPSWMRKNFSIVEERLVRELRGEPCYELESQPPPRQNIQVSRSFGEPVESLQELEKAVSSFATKGAKRLRDEGTVATAVSVGIYTSRFRTDLPQYTPVGMQGLTLPTDSTFEILRTALSILRNIYRPEIAYKRASVLLMNTVDKKVAASQKRLFDPDPDVPAERREREDRLLKKVDEFNRRSGSGHLFFASEGIDRAWRPSSQFVSPCYTTRWEDLPVAR
ncbi:MAG: Y-family DNA polymerase [Planctomycetia bacterium]|nr:Y-family DNA polymerase [Planctomycetia bacterium]